MTTQLDDVLLAAYMAGFYGYGNVKAPYWFVGIEEGGGKNSEEVARRIQTWHERGQKQIEPLREFHEQTGIDEWFVSGAKAQPSWSPLIIAILTATGRSTDDATIVRYQQTALGSEHGETCILERLPLPKRAANDWRYAEWSSLECLRTQPIYKRALEKTRIPHILRLINRHEPPIVVLYGQRRDWVKCLDVRFQTGVAFQTIALGKSRLILTDHTSAWSNDSPARFGLIGKYIREWTQRTNGGDSGVA